MRPIGILQHTELAGPGSILPILQEHGKSTQVIAVWNGEDVPEDPKAFSGLVFLGGNMGVCDEDDYPWIAKDIALIQRADTNGVPLVGHCLGSQLIAKALGGSVSKHTTAELGWQPLQIDDNDFARAWWGDEADAEVQTFQWHFDTFTPPENSVRIAHGTHCANQAFVVNGRHLLLQSHLEMTPLLVEKWMAKSGDLLVNQHARGNPATSDPKDMRTHVELRTAQMRALLERLYVRWLEGCQQYF